MQNQSDLLHKDMQSINESIDQKLEINDLKKNVEQTQLDVKLIKKDVKEILRLINAIYDFESES